MRGLEIGELHVMIQAKSLRHLLLIGMITLSLSACGQPLWYFAGGRLSGEESAFVQVPADASIVQLET